MPEPRLDGVVAASFNPDDGVVFPWPFLWGYAEAARKLGVEIATFTEVVGLRDHGPSYRRGASPTGAKSERTGSSTPQERGAPRSRACSASSFPTVLIGTRSARPSRSSRGSRRWSPISTTASISRSRREAKSWAASPTSDVPPGIIDQTSSQRFLGLYAQALTRACPILGHVKVLRQWAGCYDITPDPNPIVGQVDEVDDFFQVSGFMGHGFMMAPVMGKLMAQHIAEGTASAHVRALEPAPLQGREAAPRGDDHRLNTLRIAALTFTHRTADVHISASSKRMWWAARVPR